MVKCKSKIKVKVVFKYMNLF